MLSPALSNFTLFPVVGQFDQRKVGAIAEPSAVAPDAGVKFG
jgi:hypothetical protein